MALLIGSILLFFYAEGWAPWRRYWFLRFEGLQNPFQAFGRRDTEIVYKDCRKKAIAGPAPWASLSFLIAEFTVDNRSLP
jgi:hypothetical protein